MQPPYASIDLETTGLSSENDAIIEVGIVLFRGSEIIERWSSLVNPLRRVPPDITDLTGIRQADVANAPTLNQVRSQIDQLTRGRTIVAHNAPFDLAFLNRNDLCRENDSLDTLEVATILLPTASQFSLQALAGALQLDMPPGMDPHRALTDAYLTAQLFNRLQQAAESLPYDILEEIVETGSGVYWPLIPVFKSALAAAGQKAFAGAPPRRGRRRSSLFQAPRKAGEPIRPAKEGREKTSIDVEAVAHTLDKDGLFSTKFTNYEHRQQQVEMAYAVAQAFQGGQHLMVEAGTGTGKSIAYLLPAVYWAVENNDRVVVSTNTINLQDQLVGKDIPDLKQVLPFEFRAAVLKGRSNYICPRLVDMMRRNGPANTDEMRLLAKLLVWLPATKTGERDEISLRSFGEEIAWSRLSAENEGCIPEKCASFPGGCPLNAARDAAENAHIVVVNHALLLSDIMTGNRVLPAYNYLIVDEAHHLESATTNGLGYEADQRSIERLLTEFTHNRGLGMEIQNRCRSVVPKEHIGTFESSFLMLQQSSLVTGQAIENFIHELEDFINEQTGSGARQYSSRVLITNGLRIQPSWEKVEIKWEAASQKLNAIIENMSRLNTALDEINEAYNLPDGDDLLMRAKTLHRDLSQLRQNVDQMVFKPSSDVIYWAELPASGNSVSLHAAPLHVGPLVQEHLFHQKKNVILTSATMQTYSTSDEGKSGFDYIRERLYAWEAEELAVGSPFDFQSSTLLYLPTDMPEPNQPGYQRLLESSLTSLFSALRGRALVLFTSYAHLRQTATGMRGPLADAGIMMLQQGGGVSRQQLVEIFKAAPSQGRAAALFGTRSFWEGVDIPGPALSCVVIVKLPFDVPTDPIFAARRESFENPFYDYAVPEAVLRFRQGFGRLIRTKTDRGIVVCMDKRLLTKGYGQFFLQALPECTVQRANLAGMSKTAAAWLNSTPKRQGK